jgi:thiamine kinase-like enzyme
MTTTSMVEDALSSIPGWEGATYEELTGGLTNRTWRVVKGEHAGVLKFDKEARTAPFNTRCAEAFVQSNAAKAGLAPRVILANDELIFSEYVEGTVWGRSCFDKAGNIEIVAAALKRLHALPLTGRSFDAGVAAKRYVERVTGLEPDVVEKCSEIISSMRLPHNLCCCHNDLVAENLIASPNLMFLDWEYACDNDPFFDLATIVEHHQLDDAQSLRLLNVYFDGDGKRWSDNLKMQRKLYLALLCLWVGSRPNSDPQPIQKVVDRLSTSYF